MPYRLLTSPSICDITYKNNIQISATLEHKNAPTFKCPLEICTDAGTGLSALWRFWRTRSEHERRTWSGHRRRERERQLRLKWRGWRRAQSEFRKRHLRRRQRWWLWPFQRRQPPSKERLRRERQQSGRPGRFLWRVWQLGRVGQFRRVGRLLGRARKFIRQHLGWRRRQRCGFDRCRSRLRPFAARHESKDRFPRSVLGVRTEVQRA
jgi:hypothetical protein